MEMVVPNGYYELSATGKTITLKDPYIPTGVEQIKSIRNLTKSLDVYNSKDGKHPITFASPVITFTYAAVMANTDKIQVIVDTSDGTNGLLVLDGGNATSVNTVTIDGGSA